MKVATNIPSQILSTFSCFRELHNILYRWRLSSLRHQEWGRGRSSWRSIRFSRLGKAVKYAEIFGVSGSILPSQEDRYCGDRHCPSQGVRCQSSTRPASVTLWTTAATSSPPTRRGSSRLLRVHASLYLLACHVMVWNPLTWKSWRSSRTRLIWFFPKADAQNSECNVHDCNVM